MTRVALLTECKSFDPNRTDDEHLISVGGNTGNNAYITALMDIFGSERVNYGQLDKALNEDKYDIYLVGNLSWIVENSELPPFYYDAFKKIIGRKKRFVPISVGTQVYDYKSDFQYHPQTLLMLKEISDQAVIACRGYYTAEMLNKNGIKNIEVIGCPSLYHKKDPNFKISKKSKSLGLEAKVATGITPWPNKRMNVDTIKKFFEYAIKNKIDFIEQANTKWIDLITKNDKDFSKRFFEYWEKYSKIFYNITEWRKYARDLDFSFGGRFHGNVIPLLEGVPSLFISIDARTKEMCEYFKFPTLDILEFDPELTIDQLYQMADYSEFNSIYQELFSKFEKYANKNGLQIAKD